MLGQLASCLPLVRKYNLATLCFIAVSLQVSATTVVVTVTPLGIVIGADGKITTIESGITSSSTAPKVFLLKNRLILAGIDIETALSKDTGAVLYDFPIWVAEIDKQTSTKMSIEDFADTIKDQIPSAFAFLINRIENGKFTKEQAVQAGFEGDFLAQFVAAGYVDNSPRVYLISLEVNWAARLVNIPKVLLYPKEGPSVNPYIHYVGRDEAIKRVGAADSNQQRELANRVPVEYGIMQKSDTFTLKQASNVIRSLLAMEAKAEPQYVAFPFTVITVPRVGHGYRRTYKHDAYPLSSIPKNRARTRKGQERSGWQARMPSHKLRQKLFSLWRTNAKPRTGHFGRTGTVRGRHAAAANDISG